MTTAAPCLAAITFDPKGGGVAAVARLLRAVLVERWGDRCRFVSLLEDGSMSTLESSTAMRVRFGARLAATQIAGTVPWTFYSHLSLGKVQAFVPAPWRRPYAVFVHGVEVWGALTPSQRQVLKRAALRVANSNLTARRVADVHPEVGPVMECPLALPPDLEHLNGAAATSGWTLGPHAVILVARMLASERYKGHDELLRAWPAVRRQVPDARLVFVGDGDDVDRLKRKASSLGVADAVVFTGFVPAGDLHTIYRCAAVFAMPSSGEGFGMVYLEAMAHQLPCIGSVHDAAPEVIEDGVTGFLVEQADVAALADRIVLLLTDENRRAAMGARGQRRLHERFTYERFSRGMLELLDAAFEPDRVPARAAGAAGAAG